MKDHVQHWAALAVFALLAACSVPPVEGLDEDQINHDLKATDVKRVTEAQISESGLARGQAVREQVGVDAIAVDSLCDFRGETHPGLGNVEKFLVKEYRVVCEAEQAKSAKEREVFQAYAAAPEDAPLGDNFQQLGGDDLLYTYGFRRQGRLYMFSAILSKKEVIIAFEG